MEGNFTDNLGILPVEIPVRDGWGWFGTGKLLVFEDHLEIGGGKESERVPFENLVRVESGKGSISLEIAGKKSRKFHVQGDSAGMASLLNHLLDENRRWNKYSSKSMTASELLETIRQVLQWRGRPFQGATELLLRLAWQERASDLHLEPSQEEVRMTLRVVREVRELGTLSLKGYRGIIACMKNLSGCQSHLMGIPQEGAWTLPFDRESEARFSVFPSIHGERVSVRFIRPIAHPTTESLGWPEGRVLEWRTLLQSGGGLYLIVGPVGSGKTTALYATLSELAKSSSGALRRVATIEDPVEGRIPGISQTSLDHNRGLGLAQAFKFLLRQDPDIIALGEIRDRECLQEALQGGLTGHMVLATFHAGNAEEARNRIFQMGIEPYLLKNGLKGFLEVTLDRVACNHQDPVACMKCRGNGFVLQASPAVVVETPPKEHRA